MLGRLRAALPAVIGLVLFVAALEVLRTELRTTSWHELTGDVLNTPPAKLGLAVALTCANYAVLALYDFLALASIGKRLPRSRVVFTSFLAYAIANNVGWAVLSGASVRYRFYSRWGITGEELARIVVSYSTTFWLGLLLLGGLSVALGPFGEPLRGFAAPVGWLLVLASAAYVGTALSRSRPIEVRGVTIPIAEPRMAIAQLAVSVVDWCVAGAVLYSLLPAAPAVPFPMLIGAFMAAQLVGLASHVPGGVGVFEGLMVLFLRPYLTSEALLPALVVYRAIYYFLPLAVAIVMLVADELHQRRAQAARVTAVVNRVTEQLTPQMLAAFTFFAGIVLLFSGATPAASGRLALLHRVFPLGVIETSHFLGSLVGAMLLLLSQGLSRRLDAAYVLAASALGVGIAASLLKGADVEEALVLSLVLVLLWRAKPAFDRHAALFDTRFSAPWVIAIVGVLAASVWLGLFAFKHVEYSSELWWQFELRGEASRFLRASVGAAVVLLFVAVAKLMGHAPHEVDVPTEEDLDCAAAVIATQPSTSAFLVFLRDKAVLFDQERKGFVMYGVQGRTWVAMGDPVGPTERASELIRLFMERCDDFGGIPVFYEVRKEMLYRYADYGLAFVKLGEDATVDLVRFTVDGAHGSKHRQVLRRLDKAGATFRVAPPAEVPGLLAQLHEVSDEWLAEKQAAEKGFSLGFFDETYLSRLPVALMEWHGRVAAFANLWPGPDRRELSIDLMRYRHDAPPETMAGLLVHLMMWGKEQGYQRFSLGMAPLSGFEHSPVAPLWNRLGSFVYRHGGTFYNFQGLRAYKEKFHPQWDPRYLVYPGGQRLARIMADIAALVAGGHRQILRK
jgi:phosphatidylglycerol lysyltransferase